MLFTKKLYVENLHNYDGVFSDRIQIRIQRLQNDVLP